MRVSLDVLQLGRVVAGMSAYGSLARKCPP